MKKKIISLILATLSVCIFATSCGDKQSGANGGESGSSGVDPSVANKKYVYTAGVHQLVATETADYVMQNGRSDYKILLPQNGDANIVLAESELNHFFQEATGVKLGVVTESGSGLKHTADGKYISIGATKMLESSGVDVKKNTIGSQGVRIVTKDKTIYVVGATTAGTLNAVYTFLNLTFGYEQFAYDCFTINKTNSVKLLDFDVTDVPDIEMRGSSTALLENNPGNLLYRLRMRNYSDFLLPIGDRENGEAEQRVHNASNVLPRNAPTSRKNWFSDQSGQGGDNTQICYTAHGNKEDYEAMIDRIAYVIERSLIRYTPEKYPLSNIVAFTHEDNENVMCRCASCTEASLKYGAQSALAMIVNNDVRAKLEEWMNLPENAEYKRENLKVVFFAYTAFISAPAHYDESLGKYVVNSPDLKMRDDVGVFYAVSSGLNFQQNIYGDGSKEGVENSLKWFDIAPSVYLWTYDANFGNFLFRTGGTNFYDTDAYQFFAAGGAKYMFKQSVMPGANVTSFQMLDMYLDSHMQWDTRSDIGELTKRWFRAMFKDASDVMFELYKQENTYALIVANETKKIARTGIINYAISREYWKYEMLKGWLDKIDEARELISKYQTKNPELYAVLKEHLDIEWVCPAYYMISYNAGSIPDDEYNKMVSYFKTDISALRDFRFSERSYGTITTWAAELALR